MALVKCKECGKEMSDQADKCPGCGAPRAKGTSTATIVVGGLFAVIVGSCVFRGSETASSSQVQTPPSAADIQKEKDFQTVVAGAKWLKKNTKNPKSFELVSATMMGADAICYEYRGTNSFNAVVLNRHVITNSVNSGESKAWNKYCAGKSGVDFTYARQAL